MLQKKCSLILKCFSAYLLCFVFFSNKGFAQKKYNTSTEPPFHKGSNTVGLGLGLGIDYDYYGDITSPPAFFASYDHGIINNLGPGNLGVGGIIALKAASYKYASGG